MTRVMGVIDFGQYDNIRQEKQRLDTEYYEKSIELLKIVVEKQAEEIEALKLRELTEDEIDKIIKQHDWYSKTWVDMVRSIESAILKKAIERA
jgi:hypothetical protein